ncbi:MAG: GH32 C-terminal domain-containing protein [Prevotella sp.]|nr:GH32 C-terminal domain-containing protein [Prevotella sp.]
MKRILFIVSALVSAATAADAQSIYFPLDGHVNEAVTSAQGTMNGVRTLPYADGVKNKAVRFDGYSNYVSASPSYAGVTPASMTFSLWCAPETYPMMNANEAELTPSYAMIAGNYDATANTGIGIELSSQGGYRVTFGNGSRSGSFAVSGDAVELGKWNNIVVTMNAADRQIVIYRNGIERHHASIPGTAQMGSAPFLIGKDRKTLMSGMFNLNTFNGLIDEVRIDNGVKTAATIAGEYAAAEAPGISAIGVCSLLGDDMLRPTFHGQPAKGWTNETHGMIWYNGKYHVFFQKNGNGPYMARLHWGHITSTDLISWQEESVAIAPGANVNGLEAHDGKGCWSGAVFQDGAFNDGKPTIIYTGVSNAKAYIWMAAPKDDNLVEWEKQGVIIESAGNPCTPACSDDFRDPYFFTAGGNKYIIVGSSNTAKVGTCVLYKYNGTKWEYQGLFFSGTSQAAHGRFWEMPNVTPLADGKYLFTCTPLDISGGVHTLCWVGTIGADGKFTPDQQAAQPLEMAGVSREGYGLLSPTIYQKDGKTLMLGIVPDKLPTQNNYDMGWAHLYSLPRELSLDASDRLVQRPYSGLTAMRTMTTATVNETLLGTKALVSGRQIELLGEFTPTTGTCGFRFLKNASLTYDAGSKRLTLDLTGLSRTVNDAGVYDGIYEATLTEPLSKLHVFLDGSIADFFVNDKWAYSVRLFPTDAAQVEAEVFATASTQATVSAWVLEASNNITGIREVVNSQFLIPDSQFVYDLQGRRLTAKPQHGLYIMNGNKYVAR